MIVDSLRPLVRFGGHQNPRVNRDHLQTLIIERHLGGPYLHIWFENSFFENCNTMFENLQKCLIPESNGESRDGVERGEDFKADETAKEAAEVEIVPLLPNFLTLFIRPAKLSLSPAEVGGGCCLACCLHLARRFLNQT